MTSQRHCKVVVALPLAPHLLEQLSEHDVAFLPAGRADEQAFASAVSAADGLIVSSHVRIDHDVISSAANLRVISTMSAGFDHIDVVAARERGITVTTAPVLRDAVADLTMALMIMLARRIPEGLSSVAEDRWSQGTAMLGSDIARKVLLVVGFGRIGQAVALRALAAGMEVRYVDRRDDLPQAAGCTRVGSLAEGLRAADFVTLHIDLNPGTRDLMDADAFASMKPTAFFVNTSRGGVVDQTALVEALNNGQIAGAGLDVLAHEPPDASDPILSAPNTIIAPHIGSATAETRAAMAQCAVDNLLMVLRDEKSPFELPS